MKKRSPWSELRSGTIAAVVSIGAFSFGTTASGGLKTLHAFQAGPLYPGYLLVRGPDGATYGTSQTGGMDQVGTVYKITPSGQIKALHSFTRSSNGGIDGSQPVNGLTLANDGNFYGTTLGGGYHGHGTIFRVTPNGALTAIYHFTSSPDDNNPTNLVQGDDGYLYGTTRGTDFHPGTVFRVSLDGTYTLLYQFLDQLDGGHPGPLFKAGTGILYGSTTSGGSHGYGTFFRVYLGGGVTPIYNFQSGEGGTARLVERDAGQFYGMSVSYPGHVYRLTAEGQYDSLYTLPDSYLGSDTTSLCLGDDGNLYGAYPSVSAQPTEEAGFVFRFNPTNNAFDVIYSFTGNQDGRKPRPGLVQTGPQTFRGVTLLGGFDGHGTVFEITAEGALSTVANFSATNDGQGGSAGLLELEDHSLFGTTPSGGLFNFGAIFRVEPDGTFATLYDFSGGDDGGSPRRLVLGADDFVYGLTRLFFNKYSTLFKISRAGAFSTIQVLPTERTGELVLGDDGNFYTTQPDAGATKDGTIVRITPDGKLTVIHDFVTETDGAGPMQTLVKGPNGFLYGSTYVGGENGFGTIFKINSAGDFFVVYHFSIWRGSNPSEIVLGPDGSIYGAASEGGANDSGFIFQLTPDNSFDTLIDFDPRNKFEFPGTSLVVASDGAVHGTRTSSGPFEKGYLFEVTGPGTITTLHSFDGQYGGGEPTTLTAGSAGRVHGSTASGGGGDNLGTLFTLTPDTAATVLNLSTRLQVAGGNNVLIGGFIITGSETKSVAIRGIGPSLGTVGIGNPLPDPVLELHASNGALMLRNNDWQDDYPQSLQLSNLHLDLANAKESGMIAPLQPNAYTAILSGNGGIGVSLLEIYDVNQASTAQLANISTRGFVETGSNVMIGGLILGGSNSSHIAVRGIGPSLAQIGLSPVLPNPILELHNSNGALLITNDNWESDPDSAEQLVAYGLAPADSVEAGIFTSLQPGAFTAVLADTDGGAGVGLVEIYNLQ